MFCERFINGLFLFVNDNNNNNNQPACYPVASIDFCFQNVISRRLDWKVFFLLRVVFDPFIFIALCLTFISGLCWIATMTKFEISYAYPFTMLGFVSIILLSTFLFGESVNFYKLIGCAIIVIGVVVTSLGL